MASRTVKQGIQLQGADEKVSYLLHTAPWGGSPTNPSVKVFDVSGGLRTDVTLTVIPSGSPTVVGDDITLPLIQLLTADKDYRVEVQFTSHGNLLEPYFLIHAEY